MSEIGSHEIIETHRRARFVKGLLWLSAVFLVYLLSVPPLSVMAWQITPKTAPTLQMTDHLLRLFSLPFAVVRDHTPLGVPLRAYAEWWVGIVSPAK